MYAVNPVISNGAIPVLPQNSQSATPISSRDRLASLLDKKHADYSDMLAKRALGGHFH